MTYKVGRRHNSGDGRFCFLSSKMTDLHLRIMLCRWLVLFCTMVHTKVTTITYLQSQIQNGLRQKPPNTVMLLLLPQTISVFLVSIISSHKYIKRTCCYSRTWPKLFTSDCLPAHRLRVRRKSFLLYTPCVTSYYIF